MPVCQPWLRLWKVNILNLSAMAARQCTLSFPCLWCLLNCIHSDPLGFSSLSERICSSRGAYRRGANAAAVHLRCARPAKSICCCINWAESRALKLVNSLSSLTSFKPGNSQCVLAEYRPNESHLTAAAVAKNRQCRCIQVQSLNSPNPPNPPTILIWRKW